MTRASITSRPIIRHMRACLALTDEAVSLGEVPIASLITDPQGHVIAHAHNRTRSSHDPTAHAEILVLRQACQKLGASRLDGCCLYVTLEPCAMCAAAIALAHIETLFFGAYDPKGGGVEHGVCFFQQPTCHHRPHVIGGVCETECGERLRQFFATKRPATTS